MEAEDFEFADICQALDPKNAVLSVEKVVKENENDHNVPCSSPDIEILNEKCDKSMVTCLNIPSLNENDSEKKEQNDDNFSATNELLHRLKKRKYAKMNEVKQVILAKTKYDLFGNNPNKEPVTLLCPWCGDKKGYSIMTRHLYTKCNKKPAHIQKALALNAKRSTRARTQKNANYKAFMQSLNSLDEEPREVRKNNKKNNVNKQIINQAQTVKANYNKSTRSSNSNNNNNNNKPTRARSTRSTRRKPQGRQPSDEDEYAPTVDKRVRLRRSKRKS